MESPRPAENTSTGTSNSFANLNISWVPSRSAWLYSVANSSNSLGFNGNPLRKSRDNHSISINFHSNWNLTTHRLNYVRNRMDPWKMVDCDRDRTVPWTLFARDLLEQVGRSGPPIDHVLDFLIVRHLRADFDWPIFAIEFPRFFYIRWWERFAFVEHSKTGQNWFAFVRFLFCEGVIEIGDDLQLWRAANKDAIYQLFDTFRLFYFAIWSWQYIDVDKFYVFWRRGHDFAANINRILADCKQHLRPTIHCECRQSCGWEIKKTVAIIAFHMINPLLHRAQNEPTCCRLSAEMNRRFRFLY